jgi:hypothetical protein
MYALHKWHSLNLKVIHPVIFGFYSYLVPKNSRISSKETLLISFFSGTYYAIKTQLFFSKQFC